MMTATIDGWIGSNDPVLLPPAPASVEWLAAACVAVLAPGGTWFRSTGIAECAVSLECAGSSETVRLVFERGRLVKAIWRGGETAIGKSEWDGETLGLSTGGLEKRYRFIVEGRRYHLMRDGEVLAFAELDLLAGKSAETDPCKVVTPVSGRVARVAVLSGDAIKEGAALIVIEAMKMETVLAAKAAGHIAAIHVAEGDQVQAGEIVAELEVEGA
jgi:acetyl/propionyl-CoA carboxylase alpha subunit